MDVGSESESAENRWKFESTDELEYPDVDVGDADDDEDDVTTDDDADSCGLCRYFEDESTESWESLSWSCSQIRVLLWKMSPGQ